jgi:hypothetical protein
MSYNSSVTSLFWAVTWYSEQHLEVANGSLRPLISRVRRFLPEGNVSYQGSTVKYGSLRTGRINNTDTYGFSAGNCHKHIFQYHRRINNV